MVSDEAKWVLRHTNIDPKKIADIWGIDERECWEYIEDLNIVLREEEKKRDVFQLQKELREWVDTIPDKKNIRIAVLKERLLDAKKNPHLHDIDQLLYEVGVLTGKVSRATETEVARAKEHPIENLIEVKRNYALCPFHNEKTPSMYVKNNTYHCFGCGAHGDSINLHRSIHNTSFLEAVKALQ